MRNESPFFDHQPLFLLDHQTHNIKDVNEKALEIYGYSREEFIGMNISELGDRENLYQGRKRLGEEADKVWRHKTKDGSSLDVQFTSHMFNYEGKPVKLAVAHIVTELLNENAKASTYFPRIKSYLEHSSLAEIEWDKDFVVKDWSDKAEGLFGWKEEEVIGDTDFFKRFIHPDEIHKAYKNRERAFRNQEANYLVEGRNFTRDGKILYCEWHNSLLYDRDGNLVSIYSLVHDISERKESEKLFKALSEESLVGIYLIQDGIFQYVNPKFAEIFRYEQEEIENKLGPLDLSHPEDRETVKKNLQKRIDGEVDSVEYDFRCLTKDSQTIYVNVYGTRINYLGKPSIIGTIVNVTDRKESMEQYKASIESFEDLFDSISDAIYIQNRDGRFIEVNKGAAEMYGYDRDFFIGKTPEVLAAPGKVDVDKTLDSVERALEGEKQVIEWWGQRKNGEVFPKEVVLNPGTYFGEDVVIAIARDISDRHEAEERLRKNEELFRQLFQNAPIGIVMMDHHQEVRLVNAAFEEIFGYTSEEIMGLDIDRVIVPSESHEEAHELSADILSGNSSNLISKRRRKDGTMVDVIIYGVPVIVSGKTIAIFGIYVDITDRKEAEERIRQSLREKEVLLAEIHHRVKNNLAVITGLLELQSHNTISEDANNALRESQMRINSIALIHEKLYQSKDLSEISFDVYIKELSDTIVKLLIKEDKDVELVIDADPIALTVNQAIPCGLILNELITNSYKHAFNGEEGGQIDINLRRENGSAVLRVEDNGKGLPEDLDLANPSSLGITLIRTLSKQLNGNYRFNNKDRGRGMIFDLTFDLDP